MRGRIGGKGIYVEDERPMLVRCTMEEESMPRKCMVENIIPEKFVVQEEFVPNRSIEKRSVTYDSSSERPLKRCGVREEESKVEDETYCIVVEGGFIIEIKESKKVINEGSEDEEREVEESKEKENEVEERK
jgi:hypothetical protein